MDDLIINENERIFYYLLDKYLRDYNYEMKRENDVLEFVIKGKSKETDIAISCDPGEYTVYIGEFFHTHFEMYSSDKESEHDQYAEAGKNALEFIKDVMSNKIWIEVTFWDGEVARAGACDANDTYSAIIPVGAKKKNVKEDKKILLWEGESI